MTGIRSINAIKSANFLVRKAEIFLNYETKQNLRKLSDMLLFLHIYR